MNVRQRHTIFFKYQNCVKKITAVIANIDDLLTAFESKFENVPKNITFYIKDKDYSIECELEDVTQLYSGCLINVTLKDKRKIRKITTENSVNVDSHNNDNNNNTSDNNDNNKLFEFEHTDSRDENMEINMEMIPNGYYVRMLGVPFHSAKQSVIAFFDGMQFVDHENSIFFVKNVVGHNTGEVFVTFPNEKDCAGAVLKHNQHIGTRYIEVYHSTKDEFLFKYQLSKGMEMIPANRDTFVIKMKGFSFDIMEPHIQEFLDRQNIKPFKIHVIYDRKNRNSGVSYVELSNETDSINVFSLNRCYLGARYINIYPSNISELRMSIAEMIGTPLPTHINLHTNCMRIEGLPEEVNIDHKQIIKFFSSIDICPKRLHIKPGSTIAYAEFISPYDCQLALTRNDHTIDNHPIHLKQATPHELRTVVGGLCALDDDQDKYYQQHQQQLNFHNNTMYNPLSQQSITIPLPKLQSDTQQNCENECKSNSNSLHPTYSNGYNHTYDKPVTPHYGSQNHSRDRDRYRDKERNGDNRGYGNNNNNNNNRNNNNNEKKDWIVKLGGIPYQATKEEIIGFFQNFAVDPKSARIFYDNRGRPRGEATVRFSSKDEALQAVHALDGKYMGSRYVLLTLFT